MKSQRQQFRVGPLDSSANKTSSEEHAKRNAELEARVGELKEQLLRRGMRRRLDLTGKAKPGETLARRPRLSAQVVSPRPSIDIARA